MSDPKNRDSGTPLGRLIEECGEVLAAAGKTVRYGPESRNPEKPDSETNSEWLLRELADLDEAIMKIRTMATHHWLRDERTPMVGR